MGQTHAFRRPAEITMREQREVHEVCHHIKHGDGNINPGFGTPALNQRPQDRGERRLPGSNITNGNTDTGRLLPGTIDCANTAFSLNEKIISFFPGAWT